MKSGKRRFVTILVCCLVVAVGVAFAGPEEAEAKVKKPSKVTSFRITSIDYNYIAMKWGKQSGIKQYQVYRSTSKNGKYKLIKTNPSNVYKDTNVAAGVTYWYKIRAKKGLLKGTFSSPAKGVPRPKTPTLSVSSRLEGAKLTAGKVKGASGYIFYRNGSAIKVQSSPVYVDKSIAGMKAYTYKVVSYKNVKNKRIVSNFSKQKTGSKITASVRIDGLKTPSSLKSSSDFKKVGVINANYPFVGVEIGIVDKSRNSWYRRFQKKGLNTRSYALSNADQTFNFKNLPPGTYSYRVYVHFEGNVVHTALNHTFTVIYDGGSGVPKNGAQAAVAWAKMIANDNSFTYGTGKQAHKRGCYFCGTNSRSKPAGYEKTYCCNPFILAAYAHGAKHPKVLSGCQKGDCGGMVPSDWTKYGCFMKVGPTKSVPFTSLIAGDIIISQASAGGPYEHVWMYCGNNEAVEAGSEGWGAGSIAVKGNAQKKYKTYQTNGCYVIRYTGN